ncbi:MAG TPA: FAD-dependent thymidylate synthase [Candidatus Limnocylindrales bacterium]|nr:FAD-dependent thymidylate synthase [Candidatus Limnocylindrales bacterium]
MPFSARVLLDSVSPAGIRLTTMEVRYPRFIHSEMMTHRVFCLDADTRLYFDLPAGGAKPRRFSMTIRDFHDKWHLGAQPRPGKKRAARIGAIDPERMYDSREAAAALGYSHYTTIDANFRRTKMPRIRGVDGRNRFRGADLLAYAQGTGEHRYSLRNRLTRMRLRSCNEATREIYHTNVRDVTFSGHQPVFRVTTADGKMITASSGHRFLTEEGWLSLRDAADLALSPSGIATWRKPLRLAVNGVLLRHVDEGRTLESFWDSVGDLRVQRPPRTGKKRTVVAHFVEVISIDYVGVRPTYDLEVTGPYSNFVADGFIVHNSRNAASSRAIPVRKMIDAVRAEPAMPLWWGKNQSGMQAQVEVGDEARRRAMAEWQKALQDALAHADRLGSSDINLHKQLVNRILEPFAWITVIISATEWANFFTQRTHEDAQPEIKRIAEMMLDSYRSSTPRPLATGEWHTPLIQADEEASLPVEERLKVSVARSARVSYLSHAGTRDISKDIELYEKLVGGGANGHWSPFEHVATPLASASEWSGNFRGWEQYRKRFPQEHASTFPDEIRVPAGR